MSLVPIVKLEIHLNGRGNVFNDRRLVGKKGDAVARRSLASHCYTTISLGETKQVNFNLAEKPGQGKNNSFFSLCFADVSNFQFFFW